MTNSYYTFSVEEWDSQALGYYFITENNSVYVVFFDSGEYEKWLHNYPNLLENGYALVVHREVKGYPLVRKDPKIAVTISKILSDFFKDNHKAVLLYHCDFADKKQAGRNKLFDDWEASIQEDIGILRKSVSAEISNKDSEGNATIQYLGFITRFDNPLLTIIEEEFSRFVDNVIPYKMRNRE